MNRMESTHKHEHLLEVDTRVEGGSLTRAVARELLAELVEMVAMWPRW